MKQKQMTILAVASGALCAICIVLFMLSIQNQAEQERNEELARYGGEQVEVCVAARDIAAGERIELASVETKVWVAGLLPEGAITSSDEIMGEVASSSIMKGEVFVDKRFDQNRSSFEIPAGKQAVSVPVKTVQAVGGIVGAGTIVDIYSSGDTSTSALAKSVVVLDSSLSDSSSVSSSDSGWVTLAIDPERVQEIIAAANKTTLYFVIPGDTEYESDSKTVVSESEITTESESNTKTSKSNDAKT